MTIQYCKDPFVGRRRQTREVRVGDVGVGGANPVRVQSMTNTDTQDVKATVEQIERMAGAGCEIARVTAPSIREAELLAEIRAELNRRGVGVPLVADIHFTPNAALVAAEHVEKVRINPGNYADKKRFEVREYDDAEYAGEIERVAERFRPLVRRCKERGVALRIGTNHGSLSDRIMNRFGDTPLGMVESALEFLDVCEDEGFREIVFSMKASNTQVAIQAYRLLAARLEQRAGGEPGYPFHLGVTEAGGAEDGRIKSAIGIGSLLEDGIGDTVRVSLTEDPVHELPVALALARRAEARWAEDAGTPPLDLAASFVADPYAHRRRSSKPLSLGPLAVGGDEPVRVALDLGRLPEDPAARVAKLWFALEGLGDLACEGLEVGVEEAGDLARLPEWWAALSQQGIELPLALRIAPGLELGPELASGGVTRWVLPVSAATDPDAVLAAAEAAQRARVCVEWCLQGAVAEIPFLLDRVLDGAAASGLSSQLFSSESPRANHAARALASRLCERGAGDIPLVLRYRRGADVTEEGALLEAGVDLGAPLCDGIGDMVSIAGYEDAARAVDLAYRVLQGARLRTTRTEYISCPSCGRTLFDLEVVTARIQGLTEHLKGVKIAVMGCIVNGPGEMADADFGYVGSGPGQVTLYVGQEVCTRAVPEDEAPDRLVDLIRDHGRWVDPS
ncbi:MAG: (E)-4-hydroxy-3-methylbut-2-enyl-diphosphate synthase [Deltaproteobacteria bacterium]|nr:(E)-4-hydroxy-3-methylbut-2-enyl-diphosphate synthase [Deltaproteobacteria bacterium]